ncbi:hypothetical protein EVAR_15659_1 [Eumeta japonica]|uniref:Uncharacterized protein n=1 Tax=Eumeta variegata TaxID=151549 RepID=A0A4C1U9B0_EUMVA|nr:hypothetical protein EVAR_15659_1 [Eumeta japonica]
MAGFESFSIALDENTDLSLTAQLAVFIRGVDKEFIVGVYTDGVPSMVGLLFPCERDGEGGEKKNYGPSMRPGTYKAMTPSSERGHFGMEMPSARDCPMGVFNRYLGIGGHVKLQYGLQLPESDTRSAGSAPVW